MRNTFHVWLDRKTLLDRGSKLQTGELILNSGAVTAAASIIPCNQRSICKDGCCPL